MTLSLRDDDVRSTIWPDPFSAIYTVTFAETLSLRLAVQNRAKHPIGFEEALHTYFAISDISDIAISGLAGATNIDKTDAARRKPPIAKLVTLTAETDRVYLGTPGRCVIGDREWGRRVVIEKDGAGSTGLEPVDREGGCHGRSRRPCVARHGLRRGWQHRPASNNFSRGVLNSAKRIRWLAEMNKEHREMRRIRRAELAQRVVLPADRIPLDSFCQSSKHAVPI